MRRVGSKEALLPPVYKLGDIRQRVHLYRQAVLGVEPGTHGPRAQCLKKTKNMSLNQVTVNTTKLLRSNIFIGNYEVSINLVVNFEHVFTY